MPKRAMSAVAPIFLCLLLFFSKQTQADSTLIGHWKLDGNGADSSSYGNSGTLHGAIPVADRFGNPSSAIHFDGLDDYITIPHSASLDPYQGDSFTIAAWVKSSSIPPQPFQPDLKGMSVFTKQDAVETYSLMVSESGKARFFLKDSRAYPLDVVGVSPVVDGNWHHIVGVRNASDGTVRIYVDATEEVSVLNPLTGNYNSVDVGGIGYSGYGNWWHFSGAIDDLRIYKRALSPSEIVALYQGEEVLPSTPDTIPDPFVFLDQAGVALNTQIISGSITVSGINAAAPVSLSGGEYSINGGAFTSTPGTVNSGDNVRVRLASAGFYATTTNAVLSIGGITDTFSVTTVANGTISPPTAVGYSPAWLITTLMSLTGVGGYLLRRRR